MPTSGSSDASGPCYRFACSKLRFYCNLGDIPPVRRIPQTRILAPSPTLPPEILKTTRFLARTSSPPYIMAEETPRVNGQYLGNFRHRHVRLIGKVAQLMGETAVIDCTGMVTIHLNRESHLSVDHWVEIIGKVNEDMSIKVLNSTDFGTNIDYTSVEAVVDLTHRYRSIFYGDAEAKP
ncbi:hypothetical protein P152DRAFT_245024 [Eremomyces bilateralis CBS 781.70]|uniref:Replication factor A protein 3 n=1 Tax=Eremomyces bilateralis CBS 781.70 TaxID=1392243 RepID=A0A6G1GB07_9PEZI|nr:uncharacterized protein P152DRAFT_245024 [Eremomyces bilateralis CBS 781.70]KAF1815090.1 hypothetical protein P152DRAFT_245024 [Eremomyces bilateralis CBS 781.70]